VSHEPPSDLDRRERDLIRALRYEAVPQGLPEFHNGDSALAAAQRRIDLFGSLGETAGLEVVPHVDGPRVEVVATGLHRRTA
jgi:hypothetical protein